MIQETRPLLLGSGSPRRREILRTLRIPILVVPGRANEAPLEGELPGAYLQRVVREKLHSVAGEARSQPVGGVLVADTIVLVDEVMLGKPRDEAEAYEMLKQLSGRGHEVWTRFALARAEVPDEAIHEQTVRSAVVFRELTESEARGYAATGEGLDKAGAYAVQGLGSFAVCRVDGSYPNVVGLPACEVVSALLTSGLLPGFPP